MGITKTIKVRLLEPNRGKRDELDETLRAYKQACSIFASFLRDKKLARKTINGGIYHKVREETGLPTVLTQNAGDTAIEAIKSYRRKRGKKKYPSFRRGKSFRIDGRGFKIERKEESKYQFMISLRLKKRRITIPLECLPGHYPFSLLEASLKGEWEIKSITIVKRKKDWWVHIPISKEVTLHSHQGTPIAVDLGTVNLAVVSTPDTVRFFSGKEWWHRRRRWKEIREKLQKERRYRAIKKLGDKEKRYNNDLLHKISREIVEIAGRYADAVIVMEDLTNIRERIDFTREGNYKLHAWAFRKLQSFIEYKTKEKGIPVVYLPPNWTSATCPKCGDARPSNRNREKHIYKCHYCGYTLNDDLIGARNLMRLYNQMASDYMSGVMGCMTQPLEVAV